MSRWVLGIHTYVCMVFLPIQSPPPLLCLWFLIQSLSLLALTIFVKRIWWHEGHLTCKNVPNNREKIGKSQRGENQGICGGTLRLTLMDDRRQKLGEVGTTEASEPLSSHGDPGFSRCSPPLERGLWETLKKQCSCCRMGKAQDGWSHGMRKVLG